MGRFDSRAIWRRAVSAAAVAVVILGGAPAVAGPSGAAEPQQMAARTAAGKASIAGSYLAGRHAHKNNDFGAASRYLERALGADPGNRDLLRRTFLSRLAQGDFKNALVLARRLAAQKGDAPLSQIALVAGSVAQRRYAEAEKRLDGMSRRGLNSFMVPLARAWTLAGKKRTDAAVTALSPLRKMTGFGVLYELHAGLIRELGGETSAAERHYRSAAKGASGATLRVVQALGGLLERTGRTKEALKLYQNYVKDNPDSLVLKPAFARLRRGGGKATRLINSPADGFAEAFFNLAGTLVQENSVLMALIYGRLATALRPDFPLAQMLAARILELLDRYADAIAVYDAVSPKSPLKWSARLRKASNLEDLGDEAGAIKLLKQMASEDRTRSDAVVALGDLLRSKKRFRESVNAYDLAVRRIGGLDKRHWTLLYSRGIALERSKQWSRAEKDFLQALKLNPDQPYVLNYLGYSWVDQGINISRAKKMIERAVELRPNDGYIVDSLGWTLYRMGDYGGSVRSLERAVELRPQDPTINDHLGDAYWRVGRRLEARFQWRRALSLEPEADQIPVIRKKIESGMKRVKRRTRGG